MTTPAERLLERLERVRGAGERRWTARCPSHDDRKPSLTVAEKPSGDVLLHCHAGCETERVVAAAGLQLSDLFAEPATNGHREVVATYDYTDERGEPLFQVVRFAPKDFRQRRPDGAGGWEWRLGDTRRVLYRLPRVREAAARGERVYVVEGEKDVHAVERAGRVATCNPGGAGKWRDEYAEALAGADVVIVADRDEPRVRFLPADELLRDASPEPAWIWEGTLVRGAVTLLAGKPKAGKSTLLYALVEAAATRAPDFLGRRLDGGPVVYVSEEGRGTLDGNFPGLPDVHLHHRGMAWPKPTWTELIAATADGAQQVGAALAVIDTFSFWNGLAPDAEKDSGAVQPLLDALAQVAATGAAVLLVHHQRKAGGEGGDAIRGSGAIAGAVDAFAELERVEDAPADHRRIVVTPRWPAPPVLVVSWDEVFGYKVVGQAADRDRAGEVGYRERLLAAMPTDGEGATLDEIEQLLGADRRKWHKPLAKLIKDERVKRSGDGNRYSPYRHLRAPDAAVPHSRPNREDGGDGSTPAVHPSSPPMGTADERRAASTQPSTVPAHGTDENSDIVTARTRTEPDPDAELERLRRKGFA